LEEARQRAKKWWFYHQMTRRTNNMKMKREALKTLVANATAHFTKKYFAEPVETPPVDPQVDRLAQIIANADFGCRRGEVRELVEAIVGKDIPTVDPKASWTNVNFTPLTAFVPIRPGRESNDHSYMVGNTYVTIGYLIVGYNSAKAMGANGLIGDDMCPKTTQFRPATTEEINAWADALPVEAIDRLGFLFDMVGVKEETPGAADAVATTEIPF
jgi:hypothetical protein